MSQYYQSQRGYQLLIQAWQSEHSEEAILDLLQTGQIEPDIYLPIGKLWTPLLYAASLPPGRDKVVRYLLHVGINPLLKVESEGSSTSISPILYDCQSRYLKAFKSRIRQTSLDKKALIWFGLINNIVRLKQLVGTRYLTVDDILQLTDYRKLISYFINHLFYKLNDDKAEESPPRQTIVREGMSQLAKATAYLWEVNYPFSEADIQTLIDNYCIEPLGLMPRSLLEADDYKVQYHLQMNGLRMAAFRGLYNDARYEAICQLLRIKPDPTLYQTLFN